MKKLIVFLAVIVSSITILFSCNSTKKNKNNTANIESKEQNKQDSTKSSNETNKSSVISDANKSDKTNAPSNTTNSSAKKDNLSILLKDIKNSAENGKIFDSNFKIGQNIDTIIQKLGNPDSENYVKAAKGTYFTFTSNNIAFGCNKGNQIFEIRSFNSNLNRIIITEISNFFGNPDYKVDTKENEKILGYKINDTYKILFVFNLKSGKLKHYSVLNPSLTKNSMSGDSGRDW